MESAEDDMNLSEAGSMAGGEYQNASDSISAEIYVSRRALPPGNNTPQSTRHLKLRRNSREL